MKILNAQQVQHKLQANPDLQLIMTLGPDRFESARIPGSRNIWQIERALEQLEKGDEIIVYCSDVTCMASYHAYHLLLQAGFSRVWRFAGGLVEWAEAGYELEGNLADTFSTSTDKTTRHDS